MSQKDKNDKIVRNSATCADVISLSVVKDLELLASEYQSVLWVRNIEYDQQLYLSSTYETLWGRSCLSLYQNPTSWPETINIQDGEQYYNELRAQRALIGHNYTAIYCVNLPDGGQRWFQDRSFQLLVSTPCEKLVAGCSMFVSEKGLIETDQENISERLDVVIAKYYSLLSMSYMAKKTTTPNNLSQLQHLSKREKQLFLLFIQGQTISQVASSIHLSPRTVEKYLINLKDKLNCESKSDLIMKAIENGWLSINLI